MKRYNNLKQDEAAAATELGYVFTFLLGLLLLSLYSIWAWDIENSTRERWSEVALTENIERVGSAIERADAVARINPNATIEEGQNINLAIDPSKLHYFDPETGLAIT